MDRRLLSFALVGLVGVSCTELPVIQDAPTDGGADSGSSSRPGDVDAAVSADADGGAPIPNPCEGVTGETVVNGVPVRCFGGWALALVVQPNSRQFSYDSPCWNASGGCGAASDAAIDAGVIDSDVRFPAFSRVLATEVAVLLIGTGTGWSFAYAKSPKTPKTLAAAMRAEVAADPEQPSLSGASLPDFASLGVPRKTGLSQGEGTARVRIGGVGANGWLGVGGAGAGGCMESLTVGTSVGCAGRVAYVYVR